MSIVLVFGQQTTTSPLEHQPTIFCAWKTESTMDPQETENAKITPQNVRTSRLGKDYFKIINLMKKVESLKSTSEFLRSCSGHQVVPKTFRETRMPFNLNQTEQIIWNRKTFETEMFLVNLAWGKSKRKSREQNNSLCLP